MALLEMRRVTKAFVMHDLSFLVLRDISFSIDRGDFVSITGQSGSGKSTLMHLIGCLDTTTAGSYRIDDQEVSTMSDEQLAQLRNQRIGFVFQKFHLLADMHALDNVALPQLYAGAGERTAKERAQKMLELVGLADRLYHYPNQLSGGQQQRVAIARALVNEPDILLADEPTGNLDTATGASIMQAFERLHDERGVTLILVTHDLELARRAHRIIKLQDGVIIQDQVRR